MSRLHEKGLVMKRAPVSIGLAIGLIRCTNNCTPRRDTSFQTFHQQRLKPFECKVKCHSHRTIYAQKIWLSLQLTLKTFPSTELLSNCYRVKMRIITMPNYCVVANTAYYVYAVRRWYSCITETCTGRCEQPDCGRLDPLLCWRNGAIISFGK